MSSRVLRKLEKLKVEDNGELRSGQDSGDDVDSLDSENVNQKKSFNAFAFLEGEEDEDASDENAADKPKKKDEVLVEKKEVPPNTANTSKAKKKKTKSKKRKQKKEKEVLKVDSDEELDRILEEARRLDSRQYTTENNGGNSGENSGDLSHQHPSYNFECEYDEDESTISNYDANFKYFTTNRLKQSLPYLCLKSSKNLDPDEEFKNLFGSLSSQTIDDANTTTSLAISPEVLAQYRKIAKLTKGWGGNDRRSVPRSTRKLLLTRIKDDWLPTTQRFMSMEELKKDGILDLLAYKDTVDRNELESKVGNELLLGVRYFKFNKINSVQERVANTKFYASVVMTPDHESLMQSLQQYPYHVETLLQVAMVLLRQGGDKSTSNALIEKCLFTFDRSFHKRLHELLSSGKCGLIRLPYESFMNRQFYLCLFRYIMNLGERSTFETAFSYCKFLLSLSPAEDPMGVRYFIDYYAIKSEEYQYLINFVASPLATTYNKWITPGLAFSTVLAHLALKDLDGAKKQLQSAYKKYPYVALKLLQNIGLPYSVPVKESDFTVNDELLLAAETYLVRANVFWDDYNKRQFLHDELLDLFETHSIPKLSTPFSSIYSLFFSRSKSESPSEIPYNLLRFAILSGESKIMAKIPNAVWSRQDVFEYDVLPPSDESVSYNELTGINTFQPKATDALLDYVDQNVLGSIIQNQTEQGDFDEIIRQLQQQDLQDDDDDDDSPIDNS